MGLTFGILYPRKNAGKARMSALRQAAITASVSYRENLPPRVLADVLTGEPPPDALRPHIRKLLNEAPASLLASVSDEIEQTRGIAKKLTWARMRELAKALRCTRGLWT